MSRKQYQIFLILRTRAPLTHGEGNDGNCQIMRTGEAFLPDGTRYQYPLVSGGAMKATLREHAVWHQADELGIPDGGMSMDALRLLAKGGKNDKGGTSVPLSAQRNLMDLFPMLRVFGSLDAGHGIRGQISVSDVVPICPETIASGIIQTEIRPATLGVKGEERVCGNAQPLLEGVTPVALHEMAGMIRQYYRHDISTSSAAQLLSAEDVAARDDRKQLVSDAKAQKAGKLPGKADVKALAKDERRAANESMPHGYQHVPPGIPFLCCIRLDNADDISFGVLLSSLRRWIGMGARLGGGGGKGHGYMDVQLKGAVTYSLPSGVAPMLSDGAIVSYVVDDAPKSNAEAAYSAHLVARREEILKKVKSDAG